MKFAFLGGDRLPVIGNVDRNATDERTKNKPPRAFRELFREIRDVLEGAESDEGAGEED